MDFHMHVVPSAIARTQEILQKAHVHFAVLLYARPFGPQFLRVMQNVALQKQNTNTSFFFFSGIPWEGVDQPDFGLIAADNLRQAVAAGVKGLKVSKALGLGIRTTDGRLLAVDDARLDPLWATCGELEVPVAIHTGDPVAFFLEPTLQNERYEELLAHPTWSYYGHDYPPLAELLAARDRLFHKHPKTIFVALHVGSYAEDLQKVAASMRRLPNMWIDLAARLPELGRHPPDEVRAFFEEFQDRIVFGTDLQISDDHVVLGSEGTSEQPTTQDAVRYYQVHWKYLETREQKMQHMTPIQGRWTLDAVGLPRRILDKVYFANAAKLLHIGQAPP